MKKGSIIVGSICTGIGAACFIGGAVGTILNEPDANAAFIAGGVSLLGGMFLLNNSLSSRREAKKYFNLMIDAYNATYK